MSAYVLGYVCVILAKWTAGAILGFAVCMVFVSLEEASTGEYVRPDPMALMIFIAVGAIIALVCI